MTQSRSRSEQTYSQSSRHTPTVSDWEATRYAQALRQAALDEAQRTVSSRRVTAAERRELLAYVRQEARSGGYERLMARMQAVSERQTLYDLDVYQRTLLLEAADEGVLTLGRAIGRAAATTLVTQGLLRRLSAGRYRLTEAGRQLVEGWR